MLKRIASVIVSAEPFILAAIAPALLFPTPARLVVLILVPVIWASARLTGRPTIPRTPFNISLGLLLAMIAVSVFVTFDLRLSLAKVTGLTFGILVFWAVTRWTTTTRRLAAAITAFVFAGAGLAVVGLLGTDWVTKFSLFETIVSHVPKAIRGMPGAEQGFHPNEVAGCLILFVPLQITLLVSGADRWVLREMGWGDDRSRWVVCAEIAMLGLTTGTLLLTQSRGAWLGLLVASVAFLAWHSRTTRMAAVLCLAGGIALVAAIGPERALGAVISASGRRINSNVSGRVELWSRAISAIEDFPLTGMGMNTFREVLPVLYPTFLTEPTTDVAHAHNQLLQTALDLGVPGLIAYISIWLVAAALLMDVLRKMDAPVYRSVAGGLGCGLIAYFTFGATDAIALGARVGFLFWFVVALSAVLERTAAAAGAVRPNGDRAMSRRESLQW